MAARLDGRTVVLCAVLLQAAGKVAYGTWLVAVPSPLFVLASFSLTAIVFAVAAGQVRGRGSVGLLVLLNVATAVTFLAFFHALKLIEPAIVGAVEIGVGPPLALLFGLLVHGERPDRTRRLVCIGVLAGCTALALAAYVGSGVVGMESRAVEGLLASVLAGAGAVAITVASKALLGRGWSRGAVLAHRFYLIVPIALILTLRADIDPVVGTLPVIGTIVLVAALGVAAPLYLLQVGIERSDAYTVLSTMAALPVFTFAFEALSPSYRLSWLTAVGVGTITATLMFAAARATRTEIRERGAGTGSPRRRSRRRRGPSAR